MQASNGAIVVAIIVCAVALGVLVVMIQPDIPEVEVPTAAEIAAKIVIPEQAEVVIPDVDRQQQQEIWEEIYADEIEELEDAAIDVCEDEFKWSDVEDLFDEYADVDFVEAFDDDREFNILDLGLDDEDDRHIVVKGVIKVRVDDYYTDLVYGTCTVTSDDGDLEAEQVLNL